MISMEFTSKYVHLLEGAGNGKGAAVKQAVSLPVPERSIRNGYIRNQEELAGMLIEVLAERNFRSKDVSLTVDSKALKVKRAEIPFVSRDRVLQFVKREFGSVVSDEEHLFDYVIQDVYKKGRAKHMECSIYAIPRELLMEYNLLCKTLGLKLKHIDILDDAIAKQIELDYPDIGKEVKPKSKPQPKKKPKKSKKRKEEEFEELEFQLEIAEDENGLNRPSVVNGPVRLWVGFYYEKLKLMTNGINGEMFIKTVMLESLDTGENVEDNDKELIALYVSEIKKFIQFQEEVSPAFPIEQIEVFGEHLLLGQICNVISSFVKKSTVLLPCPKQIKGVSPDEYAKYVGGIGNLVRR